MRTARALLVVTALALAGCSSSSDGDDKRPASTTSTSSTTTSTTAPFEGTTDPTTLPLTREDTALLRSITLSHEAGVDRITFEFLGTGAPKVDLAPTDDPVADGSGEHIDVEGGAVFQVRFEPAATHDLRGEQPRRIYDGPNRVKGDTSQVTEVVNGGSFEGVLTFYVGLRESAPHRVSADGATVTVELAAP